MKFTTVILPVLLIILLGLLLSTSVQNSLTYDEKVHLGAGFSYWKTGILKLNILDHPPFAELIETFPLLFLNLKFPGTDHPAWIKGQHYRFGGEVLYRSGGDADTILFWSRVPVIALSVVLCFLVYLWSARMYGVAAGIFAAFLYTLCPNLLTHGHLATTDFPATGLIFVAFYTVWEYYQSPSRYKAGFAGLGLGLSLAAKFSAIIVVPILGLLYLLYRPSKGARGVDWLIYFGMALVVLDVCYFGTQLNLYFTGLERVFSDIEQRGRSAFLWGKYSLQGWWYYFPVSFLIKTPVPVLVFFAWKIYILICQKGVPVSNLTQLEVGEKNINPNYTGIKKKPDEKKILTSVFRRNEWFLGLPILVWFIVACTQKLNIGLRHILPVYPLLYVWLSQVIITLFPNNESSPRPLRSVKIPVNRLLKKHLLYKLFFSVLILWYIYGAVKIYPYYITYFNDFVGGARNGYKYLADSNLDWGQDLKRLKQFMLQQKVDEIYLSYFGTAEPEYYGIKYLPLGFVGDRDVMTGTATGLPNRTRELLAVSVTNLQAVYFTDKTVFSWLKNKVPITRLGNGIFVYDITQDWESHQKLGDLFKLMGNFIQADKEYVRMGEIISYGRQK